jgi:hypothetical protein
MAAMCLSNFGRGGGVCLSNFKACACPTSRCLSSCGKMGLGIGLRLWFEWECSDGKVGGGAWGRAVRGVF